jgi:hypothetical protein
MALDVMHGWLTNRSFRRAYDAMTDMHPNIIDTAFEKWTASTRLSQRSRQALHRALNVRSATNFQNHMARVSVALNEHIATFRGEPYAMLVEMSSQYAADWYLSRVPLNPSKRRRYAPKSSAWLAGPVISRLARRPKMMIPVYHHSTGSILAEGLVREALRHGIRHFVHVDDAIYSGLQKSQIVQMLCRVLKVSKPLPSVWIGAAYATATGLRAIRRKTCHRRMTTTVYAAGTIASPVVPWRTHVELLLKLQRVGPTMTVMPYKVPNRVSFGPAGLSDALANLAPEPKYKARNYVWNELQRKR